MSESTNTRLVIELVSNQNRAPTGAKFSVSLAQGEHFDITEEVLKKHFPPEQTKNLPEGVIVRIVHNFGSWGFCPFTQGQSPLRFIHSELGQAWTTSWPPQGVTHYKGDYLQIGELWVHVAIEDNS